MNAEAPAPTPSPKESKPVRRIYNQCDATVEIYPTWKNCGRPTKGKRCDLHPVKRLWPED